MSFPLLSILILGASAMAQGIPDGAYVQACRQGYRRAERIAGDRAVYRESNFLDAGCTEPSLTVRSYGTLRYGPPEKISEILDFSFTRVTLTPEAESVAASYRAKKLCGRADWALGREQDITGLACDLYGTGKLIGTPTAGSVRYGIFRVSEDGSLSFGRLSPERSGLSPDTRPSEWDPLPYVRIP